MSIAVKWTIEAQDDYLSTLIYLNDNFGKSIAEKFVQKVDATILKISDYPLLFPALEADKLIRKAVLFPQTSMFYQIYEEGIVIQRFRDNRMEPK